MAKDDVLELDIGVSIRLSFLHWTFLYFFLNVLCLSLIVCLANSGYICVMNSGSPFCFY